MRTSSPASSTAPSTSGATGRSSAPQASCPAITITSPLSRKVGASRSPIRIFGPCRSAINASGRPTAACTARTRRALSSCSSCVPWEKLSRTPSMPASTSAASVSSSFDAGPMVATIFVRRSGGCINAGYRAAERGPTRIHRFVTELLLDPQELVVLRDAIGARRRPGLDLPGVHGDGEVGDGRVLGLARAVRDDRRVARRRGPSRSRRAIPSACRSGSPSRGSRCRRARRSHVAGTRRSSRRGRRPRAGRRRRAHS